MASQEQSGVYYRPTDATKLERPRRPRLRELRAEVTRVDPGAERRARHLDRLVRTREDAEAFSPPTNYQDAAPRALLSI